MVKAKNEGDIAILKWNCQKERAPSNGWIRVKE